MVTEWRLEGNSPASSFLLQIQAVSVPAEPGCEGQIKPMSLLSVGSESAFGSLQAGLLRISFGRGDEDRD